MCLRAQLRYSIYKSVSLVCFTDFSGSSGRSCGYHSRSGGGLLEKLASSVLYKNFSTLTVVSDDSFMYV